MDPLFFPTPASFRAWLEAHHATRTELLVGFHKKGTGKPCMTWAEAVDEALCFGWIDGVRRNAGERAYTIRFSPRKPSSTWSAVNVARVEALTKLTKMHAAGLRAFALRRADKTAIYSHERASPATLTPEHARALRANRRAAAFFDAQTASYRRTAIHWVVSAKREETRDKRFSQLLADSAAQKTLAHLTRSTKSG